MMDEKSRCADLESYSVVWSAKHHVKYIHLAWTGWSPIPLIPCCNNTQATLHGKLDQIQPSWALHLEVLASLNSVWFLPCLVLQGVIVFYTTIFLQISFLRQESLSSSLLIFWLYTQSKCL